MKAAYRFIAGALFCICPVCANFKIRHFKSGQCLGFEETSAAVYEPSSGARAIMVSCQNAPSFHYDKQAYRLQIVDTNKCLDGSTYPVAAYTCGDYGGYQQWLPTPVHHGDLFLLSNGGNEGQLDDCCNSYFNLEIGDVHDEAKWFILPKNEVLDMDIA